MTAQSGPSFRDCVFCRIIADDSREFVAAWPKAVAFEPLEPVVPGHLLVVPRRHVTDATEYPTVTAMTMECAAKLATAPCNIITSARVEATQSIFHLHIHIVPRIEGDGLALPWTGQHGVAMNDKSPCRGRCEFHGKLWCNETGRSCQEFIDSVEARHAV